MKKKIILVFLVTAIVLFAGYWKIAGKNIINNNTLSVEAKDGLALEKDADKPSAAADEKEKEEDVNEAAKDETVKAVNPKPVKNAAPAQKTVQPKAAVPSTSQTQVVNKDGEYSNIKNLIISNMKKRTASFSGTTSLSAEQAIADVKDIMSKLKYANPYEYFNFVEYSSSYSSGVGLTKLSFTYKYRTTKAQEDELTSKINGVLASIIKSGMSEEAKEKAIHDWIINTTSYDQSLTIFDAYNAFIEHKAVCQGYSLLTYKMLAQAGISANIISGSAGGGPHAWNIVKINGKWYHLDVTWDDPVSSKPILRYNYFNKTNSEMSKDHTWNGKGYPTIQ